MKFKVSGLALLIMIMQHTVRSNPAKDSIVVINAGVNGNNTTDLLERVDKDVLQRSPELTVLMIGTNDMLNTRNMLGMEEYEKNYQVLLTRLKKKTKIVLMTIPPVNSEYIITRKPELNFTANGPQDRIDSANKVIRQLASKNKCVLIDLHRILKSCGGSTADTNSLFQNEANSGTPDGVHPTADGYRIIATAVYQTISRLRTRSNRIVCFGDSITFGYEVQGGGTVEGQSYPAVLNKMFNHDQP